MRSSVEYQDSTIDFVIEYRNRKTTAIHIKPPGSVVVLSPIFTPEEIIRERVRSKGGWILKKLSQVRRMDPEKFKNESLISSRTGKGSAAGPGLKL